MFRSRKFYLSLLGVVACLATTVEAIFSILDAASLSTGHLSFVGLPIAASALNVIALGCVVLYSSQYAWKRDGIFKSSKPRRVLAGTCISLSGIALIVSLASIVTIKRRSNEVTAATSRAVISHWDGYLAGQFAIWAIACLTQVVLFSIPLWNQPPPSPKLRAIPYCPPRDSVMSEVRSSRHTGNMYMLEPTLPSSPLAPASPTYVRPSQSLKSLRESLNQVVRPVTSRSKLIARPSLSRDSSQTLFSDANSNSLDASRNASQSDGFDTWDTSSVLASPTRDPVLLSAPSRGTALEPIPGSRPASPARPLDGPFLSSPHESEESNSDAPPLSPPPRILPDTSRPPSPAVSEAHIHPLFRTESPVPPPEVTPGTNVMASPLANKMLSYPAGAGPFTRARSSSRLNSPTLVQQSPFTGSFTGSFGAGAVSPMDVTFGKGAISPGESRSRSPSPPSREMTPPIPDFVMNVSRRSSASGVTAKQKVSLSPLESPR